MIPLVLVVDDEASTRLLIRSFLQKMGLGVIETESGNSALELLRKARPDVVILDLNMPNGSGWETANKLKNDPATKSLPLIAITGLTEDLAIQNRGKPFWDEFIEKPFSLAMLKRTLKRVGIFR
ncbi:MAG: response regulator [Spirochaetales bacterium]|nr:response regulator [Spirochaetales bacterium]